MMPAPSAATDPWTILTSTVRTSAALQRRADDLLRARGLHLTQLRLLLDIEDRRSSFAGELGRELALSSQAVHHQLSGLRARGALRIGPEGPVRRVALTRDGQQLASRGLDDLASLLDRLANAAGATSLDPSGIVDALEALHRAARPPRPRWHL